MLQFDDKITVEFKKLLLRKLVKKNIPVTSCDRSLNVQTTLFKDSAHFS